MKLRVARHTTNLESIIFFYTTFLNLEILGSFQHHDGYDGVFLGKPSQDWHLEFTVSDEHPNHHVDEDDLMVFYADSNADYESIQKRFESDGHKPIIAKNPYWNLNGVTFIDPDGYRIVISRKN